jgi:hypothetical protein
MRMSETLDLLEPAGIGSSFAGIKHAENPNMLIAMAPCGAMLRRKATVSVRRFIGVPP